MNKQQAIRLLDDTFNKNFDVRRFLSFVKELFKDVNLQIRECTQYIPKEFRDYITQMSKLGEYSHNNKTIEILAVKLSKESTKERARTMQRNFVAKWLSKVENDAALVAFYDDTEDWRFSFVKMEYSLLKDEKGKVHAHTELTPAKRYSYLVGINEPNHTCRSQFLDLLLEDEHLPSIEEIENAFSIENVTKEFFNRYKDLFLRLKESLDRVIQKDQVVKTEFEKKNVDSVEFAKKLLGQIVFLYFLQKKGWLGVQKGSDGKFLPWGTGPKNFMRRLLGDKTKGMMPLVPYNNFFNDILEPLFYEALAVKRPDDYYSRFNCKIPFLNGGLFEPINDYDWINTNIFLDNKIFEDILDTFDEFNFTVKEDEPLEKEVAVDPEMLGKVFENLLEVNDRKSKGAFYTPREIVHYMCQQSLINYLETNTDIPREDIEKFIHLGDFAIDQTIKAQEQKKKYHGRTYDIDTRYIVPETIEKNYKQIDELLKNIKVVDPAVGSGAFPVGMMNEIVKARSILSIFFDNDRKVYDLKRSTVENCLYGVDIMPSAVDICKLRFWLSLIVDELDMKNIKPLPNLDHKIMCGNSLLEEFEGIKLFDDRLLGEEVKDIRPELNRLDNEIKELNLKIGKIVTGRIKGDIKEVKKEISKLERQKRKLQDKPEPKDRNLTLMEIGQRTIKESKVKLNKIKKLQKQFFNEFDNDKKKELKQEIDQLEWELVEATLKEQGNEEAIQKLNQYKKSKSKPFFLWRLYFAEVFQRDNPGFDVVIGNPPYVDSEEMVKTLPEVREHCSVKYESTKGNWDLYIPFFELGKLILRKYASMTYITPNKWLSIGYGKALRSLLKQDFYQICRCDKIKVFEAGNSPVITFFINKNNHTQINIHEFDEERSLQKIMVSDKSILDWDNWGVLLSNALKLILKIKDNAKQIGDYFTVENPFTTSEAYELKELIEDKRDLKNAFKLINTGTIDPYVSLWGNKTTSYLKGKYKYPMINKNLFKEKFPRRYGQADSYKIIITGMRYFEAYLDSKKEYIAGKSTIIIKERNESLKNLLGYLNSKLLFFYIKSAYSALGIGGGINFSKDMVIELPYRKIPQKVGELVDQILSITQNIKFLDEQGKQNKVNIIKREIDNLIYDLYELTPDEIKTIEHFFKK